MAATGGEARLVCTGLRLLQILDSGLYTHNSHGPQSVVNHRPRNTWEGYVTVYIPLVGLKSSWGYSQKKKQFRTIVKEVGGGVDITLSDDW